MHVLKVHGVHHVPRPFEDHMRMGRPLRGHIERSTIEGYIQMHVLTGDHGEQQFTFEGRDYAADHLAVVCP